MYTELTEAEIKEIIKDALTAAAAKFVDMDYNPKSNIAGNHLAETIYKAAFEVEIEHLHEVHGEERQIESIAEPTKKESNAA